MSNITVHTTSVEYLYLPFTTDVDVDSLASGQVTFSTTPTLPDDPDWVDATLVEDSPAAGTNSLRVLHGDDVTLEPGVWFWWGRFTDAPETPVERGPNRIRVTA